VAIVDIDELIDRAASGYQAPSHLTDTVISSDSPVEVKRWKCWLYGELALRRGDSQIALLWLAAADKLTRPGKDDVLWIAEYESTKSAYYGIEEPGRALQAAESAWNAWSVVWAILMTKGDDPDASGFVRTMKGLFFELTSCLGFAGVRELHSTGIEDLVAAWTVRALKSKVNAGVNIILLAGRLGLEDLSEHTRRKLLDWIAEVDIDPTVSAVMSAMVHYAAGDAALWQADRDAAFGHWQRGLDGLTPFAGHEWADDWLTRLTAARADGMAGQGRYEDAIREYDQLMASPQYHPDRGLELRVAFLRLADRRRAGEEDLDADVRALVDDYESYAREAGSDEAKFEKVKSDLEGPYRLLLEVLARDVESGRTTLDDLFGLISALRDERLVVGPEWLPDFAFPDLRSRPLRLLDRRLARLADTALLIFEPAFDRTVAVVLEAGVTPMWERVDVAILGEDFNSAAAQLIRVSQLTSDVLIARGATPEQLDSAPMERAAVALCAALPASILARIGRARTLLVSASSYGQLDELPIEALRFDDEWLGIGRVVSRFPNLGSLLDALAPNRYNTVAPSVALVIRAEDPEDLDVLSAADRDAERVAHCAQVIGLDPRPLHGPTADEVLDSIASGARLLHYVGHGMAGGGGEALLLGEEKAIHGATLRDARRTRPPFSYLSACLVGRGRHIAGGHQAGFGSALLQAGAPGVIAATYAVPDHICERIAVEFYRASRDQPAGEALRQTRERLADSGWHPVAWSAFALWGDPLATIAPALGGRGLADSTLDWPGYLTRFLATEDEADRDACLAGLESAKDRWPGWISVFDGVASIVRSGATGEDDSNRGTPLTGILIDFDVEAATALRLLFAHAAISAWAHEPPSAPREEVLDKEVRIGLSIANALSDNYARVRFALHYAQLLRPPEAERFVVVDNAIAYLGHISVDRARVKDADQLATARTDLPQSALLASEELPPIEVLTMLHELGDARATATLGGLLIQQGDIEAGEEALERAIKAGFWPAAVALAQFQKERGDSAAAERTIQRATELLDREAGQ
jgi:CHAT domain